MYLIVGLGNPGPEYSKTRHNVGFLFVDYLQSQLAPGAHWKKSYKGLYTLITLSGQSIILLKPQTYMNLSGESISACMGFYDLSPDRCIMITDDVDMEFGKVRYRASGSAGGHNGIKSAIAHLGTSAIPRLKIGVGRHPHMETSDWVLSAFSSSEREDLESVFDRALDELQRQMGGEL